MMEEEDDDMHFLLDDDEAEVATYNLLVEEESSRTHRRSDGPPKVIRRGTFLLVIRGSKPTTSYQIQCTTTSNSVEGIDVHISNNDSPMSLVPHIRSVVSDFGCVVLYSSALKRL